MAQQPKKKRRASALPRRVWYGPDKMRAAYLAGQGKSGGEIAAVIGGTTSQRVRAMLRSIDIPLMRDTGNQGVLFVRWKTADQEHLTAAAAKLGREPGELAALLLRKALAADLHETMVHPLDVVG